MFHREGRVLIGVTDWDGDGRTDVIANTAIYLNAGKGKEQKFHPLKCLPTVYIPYPHPYAIDWNGDGDEDLLISSSYHTVYLLERSYVEHGYAEGSLGRVERARE